MEKMAEKAASNNLNFRPHFKTHQSLEVGRWFRDFRVTDITVSSVSMAHYFAQDNWKNITIAFPFNTLESSLLTDFNDSVGLNLCVESVQALKNLEKELKRPANAFIKTDIGYHRTGVDPSDQNTIEQLIEHCAKNPLLNWAGFLGHAGHSYACRGTQEILEVHQSGTAVLATLKDRYNGAYTSYGDTPTCSVANSFTGIDELRPGNFVYYDLSQYHIGSCSLEQIAVCMACPVVTTHPERNQAVLYGGGVHFSKDRSTGNDGAPCLGLMVKLTDHAWEPMNDAAQLVSLSQEHGILQGDATQALKPGDVVGVLPVHSCMAVDCMKDKGWTRIVG